MCFDGELKYTLDNHLNDYLWYGLVDSFIEYVESISLYVENKYRIMTMKSTKDNTKTILDDLSIEYNKLRQQIITDDLLLITNSATSRSDSH